MKPSDVSWGTLTCSLLMTVSAACCRLTSENISTREKSKNFPWCCQSFCLQPLNISSTISQQILLCNSWMIKVQVFFFFFLRALHTIAVYGGDSKIVFFFCYYDSANIWSVSIDAKWLVLSETRTKRRRAVILESLDFYMPDLCVSGIAVFLTL